MQMTKNLLAQGKYDEMSRYFYGKTNRKRFIEMPSDCGQYPDKYLLPGDVLKFDSFEALYMGNKQTCRVRYLSPIEMIFMANKLLNLNKAQTHQIITNFNLFQKLCVQGHGRFIKNSVAPAKFPKSLNASSVAASVVVRGGVVLKTWSVPVNAVQNIAKPIKTINVSYAAAAAVSNAKEIPLSDLMAIVGKVSDALSASTWVVLPAAVLIDLCRLGYAYYQDFVDKDGDRRPREFILTAASISGGWVGGLAGGWAGNATGMAIGAFIGSFFGGVGAIPGAMLGGLIGTISWAISCSIAASFVSRKLAKLGTEYAFRCLPEPNPLKNELIQPRSQILFIWQIDENNFKIYYVDNDILKNECIAVPIHTTLEEYLSQLTEADKESFSNVVYAGYENQNVFDLIKTKFEDPIGIIMTPHYILFAAAMISASNYKKKEGQILQIIGISEDYTFKVFVKLNPTGFDILNQVIVDGSNASNLSVEIRAGLVIAVKMEVTPKTEKLMDDICQNLSTNTFLIDIKKECAECMAEFLIKTRHEVLEQCRTKLNTLQLAIEA
uniref:Uncharacterized protein n=1 Tax=Panagrolaimus davidi TaxID=227884 RepID=A0A914PJQ1_9BILA